MKEIITKLQTTIGYLNRQGSNFRVEDFNFDVNDNDVLMAVRVWNGDLLLFKEYQTFPKEECDENTIIGFYNNIEQQLLMNAIVRLNELAEARV